MIYLTVYDGLIISIILILLFISGIILSKRLNKAKADIIDLNSKVERLEMMLEMIHTKKAKSI